ncbi:MAG: hypothetical protein VB959_07370 [Rhodospirillales bacterium]
MAAAVFGDENIIGVPNVGAGRSRLRQIKGKAQRKGTPALRQALISLLLTAPAFMISPIVRLLLKALV